MLDYTVGDNGFSRNLLIPMKNSSVKLVLKKDKFQANICE